MSSNCQFCALLNCKCFCEGDFYVCDKCPHHDSDLWTLWDRETEYFHGDFESVNDAGNYILNTVDEEFIPDLILVKLESGKCYFGWDIIDA